MTEGDNKSRDTVDGIAHAFIGRFFIILGCRLS